MSRRSTGGHRVVLAGNNEAAVLVLELLSTWLPQEQILAIAPSGGTAGWHSSLADAAAQNGIRVIRPADVNSRRALAEVERFRADLLLSVYYTQIFAPDFLARIEGLSLNFHPSLLPKHRGVAPIVWAIVEGDNMTGVTAHGIDSGVDTGPVFLQRPIPIHQEDTGYVLHRKIARLVRSMAAELIGLIDHGSLPDPTPQSGTPSVHAKADQTLNRVRWSWAPERVRNVVRALAPPLPGAYVEVRGRRVVLARVSTGAEPDQKFVPGTCEMVNDANPRLWLEDGCVNIETIWFDGEALPGSALQSLFDLDAIELLQ